MLNTNKAGMDKKPKIIIRKAHKKNGTGELTGTVRSDETGPATEQPAVDSHVQDAITPESPGASSGEHRSNDGHPDPPVLPPIPGFDVSGASRVQDNALRNLLVFADCCVQTGPEGVFNVIARNFDNVGALGWWLQRVGKGELLPRTKGKDLVDAIRVISHTLYRQLRDEIGKPVPRW
jgi:hypothetical protein